MAAYRRSALCPSKRGGAWRKAASLVAPAIPEDVAGALENAAAQLDDDPDVVALVLEGVMYQIVGA
ncbi:MAG TPA: hypothetical protein VKC57_16345, partial [Ktedonobacterales bacterium]|nr:hypothetical protein [Ktedonobacterales bacterium]